VSEIDIRGEPCGMPVLRVEKFLLEKSGGSPFTVLGDDAQTMDQLRLLAARHGWRCEVAPQANREFRAAFEKK
jgi:TusA-related sulfurtransferase